MLLPLKQGTLYGPVDSRRYGRSLGINLSPFTDKLCSFNCVYCHYGQTARLTMNSEKYRDDLPAFEDVIDELEESLESPVELDLITFSGNGEPTLHPWFPELVDAVIDLRDRCRPNAKVALLSNTTGLDNPKVRKSVTKLDLPVFKLDAGTEETFKKINRPARQVKFNEIVEHLGQIDGIYLQTVLVDGTPSNTEPDELLAYFELLGKIEPREVHLYSTDRPVPSSQIYRVDPEWLEDIASQIRSETGVPAVAFYNGKQD
ncbi:MAG: radical SAM protein [Candidatus Latescibacterota bacterium]|nr:MAG: radical SAM protein [Candidatus Latescibacterota bacterium]